MKTALSIVAIIVVLYLFYYYVIKPNDAKVIRTTAGNLNSSSVSFSPGVNNIGRYVVYSTNKIPASNTNARYLQTGSYSRI